MFLFYDIPLYLNLHKNAVSLTQQAIHFASELQGGVIHFVTDLGQIFSN